MSDLTFDAISGQIVVSERHARYPQISMTSLIRDASPGRRWGSLMQDSNNAITTALWVINRNVEDARLTDNQLAAITPFNEHIPSPLFETIAEAVNIAARSAGFAVETWVCKSCNNPIAADAEWNGRGIPGIPDNVGAEPFAMCSHCNMGQYVELRTT